MTDPEQHPDPGAAALGALLAELREEFGDALVIRSEDTTDAMIWLEPARPGALGVSWIVLGGEVVLTAGHEGGRWELEVTEPGDVAFLREVVLGVAAGRVSETFGRGRSHVEVTLTDGTVAAQTGHASPGGCLPQPGWRRRGKRVTYRPWH